MKPDRWIALSFWGVLACTMFFTVRFITDALIYRATLLDLLQVVIGWYGFLIAYPQSEVGIASDDYSMDKPE